MDRIQKSELVASMGEVFSTAGTVVVVHYDGLDVANMTALRGKMRDAGAELKVVKNRLTRLALKDTDFEGISDLFTGPVAIGFSEDVVAPAKVLVEFAKGNDALRVIGGSMGTTVLDEAGVKSLAAMPSLDELRGKLVGVLQAPAQKLAAVTQAPAGQLARVFGAYSKSEAA